jgi:uncharacterized membrane protein
MSRSGSWMQRHWDCLVAWLLLRTLVHSDGFVVCKPTQPSVWSCSGEKIITGSDPGAEYKDRARIEVASEITLPFAANVAFDAFADLRRQPSFSKWLKRVEYIDGSTTNQVGARSRWTIAFSGLRFSWQAESKQLDREQGIIEWGSVTGLRNEGKLFS